MKASYFLLLSLELSLFIPGCAEDTERENPLDARNERTGGAPPGMTAHAGDSQVILSWPNLGFEGVKEFRIYRASPKPDQFETPGQFEFVTSVAAEPIDTVPDYSYTDTGLLNDDQNRYFFRLSYVDDEDVETPDPAGSEILGEDWFHVDIIPSEAPPTPDVQVMEDTDLQVRLIWEGYSLNAPDDLAGFKVFAGVKVAEGQEQDFTLVARIENPEVEFYIDGNDYPRNSINFTRDGITKVYKVVALDAVEVESEPAIVEGTSPNLPPNPPIQVRARWAFGINSYEVAIEWRRNLEPDTKGYIVYALKPDGTREFKKRIEDPNETEATISDRYVVTEGVLLPKDYYVTAFDKTPKSDGKRDESEPSQIVSGI